MLWRRVLSHETPTTTVLFDREIAILTALRSTENGPSSAATYQDNNPFARTQDSRGDALNAAWAVSSYGQFNENRPLRETQPGVWVEGLTEERRRAQLLDRASAPEIDTEPTPTGQWQLGPPSLTRELLPTRSRAASRLRPERCRPGLTSRQRVRGLNTYRARRVPCALFAQETGQG